MYRAKNVMNFDVVTIRADATVAEAIATLLKHNISGLPVVADGMRLVGLVTEHHLVQAIYRPEIKERRVCGRMTREIVTVTEDTLLSDVANIMVERHIRRIPVVHGDRLVGIISRRDLLRYVTENEKTLDEFLTAVRAALPSS